MRKNMKAMLAAVLIAGAATLTGCTADMRPAATTTPQASQQQTARPETEQPQASQSPEMEDENVSESLTLKVNGEEINPEAARENGDLLLPLAAVGEALGWKAEEKTTEEETQTRHEIVLEKENSRITVSYQVSDNTIRRISWQKDGLIVPVDTRIEIIGDAAYVPASFFEEAMGVSIAQGKDAVEVSSPEPIDTPQINQ